MMTGDLERGQKSLPWDEGGPHSCPEEPLIVSLTRRPCFYTPADWDIRKRPLETFFADQCPCAKAPQNHLDLRTTAYYHNSIIRHSIYLSLRCWAV